MFTECALCAVLCWAPEVHGEENQAWVLSAWSLRSGGEASYQAKKPGTRTSAATMADRVLVECSSGEARRPSLGSDDQVEAGGRGRECLGKRRRTFSSLGKGMCKDATVPNAGHTQEASVGRGGGEGELR